MPPFPTAAENRDLKSDQHQISPCNINALLNRVVVRIKNMITQDEFA